MGVDSITPSNDTLLTVNLTGLISGNTYFIKTIKQDSTECVNCNPDTASFKLALSILCNNGCAFTWAIDGASVNNTSCYNPVQTGGPFCFLPDICQSSTLNVGYCGCACSSAANSYSVFGWTNGSPSTFSFAYSGTINGATIPLTTFTPPASSCFITCTITTMVTGYNPPTGPGDPTYCYFGVVNVYPPPNPNFTVTPVPACVGTPVCFTTTPCGAYTSDFLIDNTTFLSGITGSCVTLPVGTHTIENDVYLSSSGPLVASCQAMQIQTFVVSPNPMVNISASSLTICPGQSTTLTATGATSYTWSTSATTSSIVVSPTVATTYTVMGANAAGCKGTKTITIFVTSGLAINATATPTAICVGKSATLTASGASTYVWNPGGPGTSIVVTPTASTIYTVTGTSSSGCVGTKTIQVNVVPPPNLTITASAPYLCNLGGYPPITLTVTGASTYTWLPVGTFAGSTSSVISHGTFSTTTYTVIGTSAAGCTNTAVYTVTVVECCSSCSVSIFAPKTFSGTNTFSSQSICVNYNLTLAPGANWTGGRKLYQTSDGGNTWIKMDSTVSQFDRFQRINSNLAYMSAYKVYKLQSGWAGIKEQNSPMISILPELRIFPNPIKNNFTIELILPGKTMFNLRIISIAGNSVVWEDFGQKEKVGKYEFKISQKLAAGEYFVYVMTNEGATSKKIIITD